MDASSSSFSSNLYAALGVDSNASFQEIKLARNKLARQLHEDKGGSKEAMQRINAAFAILSDSKKRKEYDECRDDDDGTTDFKAAFGFIDVGYKLSDEFIKKISLWALQGAPRSDQTLFNDISQSIDKSSGSNSYKNLPLNSFKKLISTKVSSVNITLSQLIRNDIWSWSHTRSSLAIDRKMLLSPVWDLSPQQSKNLQPPDFSSKTEKSLVSSVNRTVANAAQLQLPNVKEFFREIHGNIFKAEASGIFPKVEKRVSGTQVYAFPARMESKLGYIPLHTVTDSQSVVEKKGATNCSCCQDSFSILKWRYNCTTCGTETCSDCLSYQHPPDYVEPVKVCTGCESKLILKITPSEWTSPLDNNKVRKSITPTYLYLIDVLGYASKTKFLEWAELFIADGRYDLAMQCYLSAQGDWISLACKLASLNSYNEAATCLNQMNLTKTEWEAKGSALFQNNPFVALLCFNKAGLSVNEYINKALTTTHPSFGVSCLLMAKEMYTQNGGNEGTFFELVANQAYQQKNYLFVIACYHQLKHNLSTWVQLVNTIDLGGAELCVHSMHHHLKFRLASIQLNPDRDHLRWQFLGAPNFNTWLDYLLDLLKKTDGTNCIPYFKSTFSAENFVVHRDNYLSHGDLTKAMICHRLITNGLSWKELGNKCRSKNESAAIECYRLSSNESLEIIGDKLFAEKNYTLALRCWLEEKKFDKILEKSKTAEYATRLLYQVAIWKNRSDSSNILLYIAQTLMTLPENLPGVKNLMISNLQEKGKKAFHSYKFLAEAGLSDAELLGLLEEASSICSTEQHKTWYAETLEKTVKKIEHDLSKAIFHCSLKDLPPLLDLINPLTLPAIKKVLKEFQIDKMTRGPQKSVGLIARSVASLVDPSGPGLLSAMNDITEAMLGDPAPDCVAICSKLVEKIQNESTWKLRDKTIASVAITDKSEFTDRLKRVPQLKMLIKAEEALAQFEPFTAAMSYIDLCMAISDPAGLVGGFLSAALELVKAQKNLKQDKSGKESYAYRRAIFELVATAVTVGHRHLCPTTHLYALRSSIAILTSALKPFKKISELEQMFLEDLYNEVDKIAQIVPLAIDRMVQVYDLIYLNLVNTEFLSKYLSNQRDAPGQQNPMYQYYIFEGTWKGWLNDEEFIFEEERKRTMQALLTAKGNTSSHVEALMNWPVLNRDSEGWLSSKPSPLNLEAKAFSRVDGIRFNLDTGEVSLILIPSQRPMESLFDMNDVSDILKLGVTGAQFTLDPPEPNMPNHPFQNMLYAPESISGTNYLGTMLHTDLLLKMLSMGTEISSQAPFNFRDAEVGLLKRLPEDLRAKFKELRKEVPQTAGRVHRFWIEAGELPYKETQKDNEITFLFGKCNMSVKKHLMRYNREGKLEDTEEDNETDSPEAKFAKLMTDEYDNLGKYYPELARLAELVKLQAMSIFIQSIDRSMKEQSKKLTIPNHKIESVLKDLRRQITYPRNDYYKINELVEGCLRDNGVTRYNVPSWQLTKLENDITQQCKEADSSCIQQVTDVLRTAFHVDSTSYLRDHVKYWLDNNTTSYITDFVKPYAESYQKNQYLTICEAFKKAGVATEHKDTSVTDLCTWVPAAFRQTDFHYKIYGGVNMQTRLNGGGGGGAGGGAGGFGGGGRAGYVEGMNANGTRFGTATLFDRNNGVARTYLSLEGCIRDRFNSNAYKPNTTAYWHSNFGHDTTRYYSAHTNGASHVHGVSGYANCTNAAGNTATFRSGDRNHRCENN